MAGERRVSWLLLATLLGLTGCALIGVLHPLEHYDPERGLDQAGRHLRVHLEVTTSRSGDGWARGDALALDPDGRPYPREVSWIWFRAEEPPQNGDRVQGRALLKQEGNSASLLLDGPRAAVVTPGPVPISVHWPTLLEHPQPLTGRLLLLNGHIDGGHLRAPDGAGSCPISGPVHDYEGDRFLVRLQRDRDRPGWTCVLEGHG